MNFNLKLAMLAEAGRPWRILTSDEHSTVWDGEQTLFDFNFRALGVLPAECFRMANQEQLAPGVFIQTYFAEHYTYD